jgi:hypothetical protein
LHHQIGVRRHVPADAAEQTDVITQGVVVQNVADIDKVK